jgi:hypothetical protein
MKQAIIAAVLALATVAAHAQPPVHHLSAKYAAQVASDRAKLHEYECGKYAPQPATGDAFDACVAKFDGLGLPDSQVHDMYLYMMYAHIWHTANDLLDWDSKNGGSTNEMEAQAHDAVKYEALARHEAAILGIDPD